MTIFPATIRKVFQARAAFPRQPFPFRIESGGRLGVGGLPTGLLVWAASSFAVQGRRAGLYSPPGDGGRPPKISDLCLAQTALMGGRGVF